MVDRPLVATVGRMERRGIKVDRDYLAKLSRRILQGDHGAGNPRL
jgi:DNA polymerase I-like protein with 3'-5' exonuclease and polymerase domains